MIERPKPYYGFRPWGWIFRVLKHTGAIRAMSPHMALWPGHKRPKAGPQRRERSRHYRQWHSRRYRERSAAKATE
jgi:hypothetical protein